VLDSDLSRVKSLLEQGKTTAHHQHGASPESDVGRFGGLEFGYLEIWLFG
jgi:hypothetical protein